MALRLALMSRDVVITGLGAVSGYGVGAAALWDGLLSGKSALRRLTLVEPAGFRSRHGAEVAEFSAKEHVPKHYRKALKVMARDTEMAVVCAKFAVEHAGLKTKALLPEDSSESPTYAPARVGCQIGAGLIAAEVPELAAAMAASTDAERGRAGAGGFSYEKWGSGGMENLTPLWLLKYLPNMLACHVTILHDARGPSNTITCAEASGLLSIGESVRVIQRGAADACFSGSCESKLNHMGIQRLEFAGRLAATPDDAGFDASGVVRPYDAAATGGLLGEGGGILMLEAAESCAARGGRGIARVLGFGAGLSASLEAPDGEGLRYAIENALEDAGTRADEVDAIAPQGCGAAAVDRAEAEALRAVFGARLKDVPLVTLAPLLGECVAGAGGLASVAAAQMIAHQTLPARIHAGTCPADLRAGASKATDARLRRVLVCTGSLGGQCAAVVLGPAGG